MCVCVYLCVYIYEHIYAYVCMQVCMYVCMYVFLFVYAGVYRGIIGIPAIITFLAIENTSQTVGGWVGLGGVLRLY